MDFRRMLNPLLLALWWAAAASAQAGEAQPLTSDPQLELHVNRVAAELRCLVCQNQSLADSHAPLALDLKNQVREQLKAGRSDDAVLAYMTDRYGDFVRYRPAFKPVTLLLWTGPALLLLAGLALLWRQWARLQRQPQAAALGAGELEQARALLDADQPLPQVKPGAVTGVKTAGL